MDPGVRFSELLAYNEDETGRWKQFFEKGPAALELACDVAGAGTVRNLVLHVFQTELFFANLLNGIAKTDFDRLPSATQEELFEIHADAQAKFQRALSTLTAEQWDEVMPLGFRDFKASRRKMLVQAMLHGVHHRAQLATFLRQQGFKQDWSHDILLSAAMP
jgi:uncharacterized damage-inducible protein DinB